MLVPVITEQEIDTVVRLAKEIWNEHCHTIVGKEKSAYMLQKIQSKEAITRQISEQGVHYFLVTPYFDPIGYVALVPLKGAVFISKMYVLWHYRSKGYGATILDEVYIIAREMHKPRITLRVAEDNDRALQFFHKSGFKEAGHKTLDLGENYTLENILMARLI